MIYTVGLVTEYEPRLAAGPAVKHGRTDTYPGGMVWRTAAEAQAYLLINDVTGARVVYGIEADWDTDTVQEPGESYGRLVRDAAVVRLT